MEMEWRGIPRVRLRARAVHVGSAAACQGPAGRIQQQCRTFISSKSFLIVSIGMVYFLAKFCSTRARRMHTWGHLGWF